MGNKTIRIAHIMGKWLGGGVEAVVMNYYKNIDRTKIQFDFLCDDDSTDIPYEEIEKLGGKVILIPPYQHVIKYERKLYQILKEENYKIVHSHINTLSIFPLRVAKKANVPVRIAHSHSTTNKKEWKKNLLKQVFRPFSKIYATHYFACSELAGRWLFTDKTFDNNEVYVLNNAIDIEKFSYNEKIRKAKRKELGISDDQLIIGHIGRFVEQKNHRFLIELFKEFKKKNKNAILLLAGKGPLMEEMQVKVKELNIEENVKFLGQRSDVNELYQAFDMFWFPSLYEGLGMVLVEAQAAGCYCVASTEVPQEANVTEKVKFYDLKDNITVWAANIPNDINEKRKFSVKKFNEKKYNLKIEAKSLEKKYIEFTNL